MSRSRLAASDGFTLIELRVVVLIIAVLATVGLASFLHTSTTAWDVDAKSYAATAATALETWATDHAGYDGATPAELVKIEPSLGRARHLTVRSTSRTYTVSVESAGAGGTFSVQRRGTGEIVRDCSHPGAGACADRPDAAGDRW